MQTKLIWGDQYEIRKEGIFKNFPGYKWWLLDKDYKNTIVLIDVRIGKDLVDKIKNDFVHVGNSYSVSREELYLILDNREDDIITNFLENLTK